MPEEKKWETLDAEEVTNLVPAKPDTTSDLVDWQNIERQTLLLEERVKFADRYLAARDTLIRKITKDGDWTFFGDVENDPDKAKACLSADGAMRIMDIANLPIEYHDVRRCKEDIEDRSTGKIVGYRWIYEGYASMYGRTIQCVGQYSTREAFLGKKGGEYRDELDVNENHVMKAAHTHFKGNCVKDLLGINSLPYSDFLRITRGAGRDPNKVGGHAQYNQGGQGGVTDKQRQDQDKLWGLLTDLAAQCLVVTPDTSGDTVEQVIGEPSVELVKFIQDNNADASETYAKSSLKALTTWRNNQGNVVKGHADLRKLKQKQAYMAWKNLSEKMKEYGLDVE
jgi:hypothetical protein